MSHPGLFDDVESTPSESATAESAPSDAPDAPREADDAEAPDLNAAQRRAVTASLRPQLVVAGPGTGKTRVLVYRTAHLLTEHADRFQPSDVAVITFTRKAARQLTTRLASIIGAKAQHVRAGTIHQFCARILTDVAGHDAVPNDFVPDDFVVASEAVTDAFWQRWFEANEGWCTRHDLRTFQRVKTLVSRAKLGIETSIPQRLREATKDYHAMLNRRGALDFDDLLTKARTLVDDHPAVRRAVQEQTRALLVDEFQDTDPVQYHIFKRLGEENPTPTHLFAVADDDQSIYRFRGAEPENVKRFVDDFGCGRDSGRLHVLRENYRSNRAIYSVAETVLAEDDRMKFHGEVVTVNEDRDPVVITACADESAEIDHVQERVETWIDDGVPRGEIAVLARWRTTVQELEQTFLRAGIACEASTSDPIMRVQAVRQLLAMLHFVQRGFQRGSLNGPLDDLLHAVLPDEVYTRIRAVWQDPDAGTSSLWTTFEALVADADVAQAAQLGAEWHRLGRLYAAIGNVMQHARTEEATIGSLAAETMRQLGGSTQLLSDEVNRLVDPLDVDGVEQAASVLRAWTQARTGASTTSDPSGRPRALVYARRPRRMRLWRALMRHALDLTGAPDHVPTRSPAAFLASDDEQPPPLSGDDVVVTADLEGFLRWASGNDVLSDAGDPPRIVLLGRPTTPDETLHLGGVDPSRVVPVAPAASPSPSVRLFTLLQATVAPPAPEPLFADYVMVDLETTSLDVEHCRVAEIGALRVCDGKVVDTFERLVVLPDDLTAEERETLREVCGLDPDTDFDGAVPLDEAWRAFRDFSAGRPLVAHNGRGFDFRVLKRLRNTYAAPPPWTATYDTLPAATELCPDLNRHSAEHLRRALLDDDTPTAHRALADCRDQQRIVEALQARRAERQRMTALEPLLPLVLAGTYDEVTAGGDGVPERPSWTERDRALLEVGYRWALRDASPATEMLGRLLSRALPELVRATSALYEAIDEDRLLRRESDGQPGLSERIEALLAPYRNVPVRDGLREVLSHLALWGAEDSERGGDVVTLSTYHSAKGLEFECVICSGVRSDVFPAFFDDTEEDRRESRRVLYVGMTRAERRLVVTHPVTNRFGKRVARSPFLRDVPDDLVEERRAGPAD